MKSIHSREVAPTLWPAIRNATPDYRILLQGEKGRPDNFELGISRVSPDTKGSARHKHAFDQFRYALEGEIAYGPSQSIPEGCLAYFPEGTHYGPFKMDSRSRLLTLQFGGPSGHGHIHLAELAAAQEALKREGSFEDGVYTWYDAAGKKHNEDGHWAVWKRGLGKPVSYPAPRYSDPILIYPQNYAWRQIAPGLSEKLLGVFNERNTYVCMLRIGSGKSYARQPGAQATLHFVIDGAVGIDSLDFCQQHDAFHLEPGDHVTLTAQTDTTLLVYGLPAFT